VLRGRSAAQCCDEFLIHQATANHAVYDRPD
jgi:hypothetical protein